MKCCPTCKRPFAPEIDVGGPVRQRVFDFIAGRDGVTRADVMSYVYADDPRGGPTWDNVVAVHVACINRVLERQQQKFRIRSRGGPGAVYKLITL